MPFKRLTAPQRETLRCLRALGEMVISPQDARPLRALKLRGYVRFATVDGVRVARYRSRVAEKAEARRRRSTHHWYGWGRHPEGGTGKDSA
jgi:hypothetical protein